MLPRRCWNEPQSRKAASPLTQLHGSKSALEQGSDFAPGTVAPGTSITTPPPAISTKAKAGKGIRTLDIQLGNQHPR